MPDQLPPNAAPPRRRGWLGWVVVALLALATGWTVVRSAPAAPPATATPTLPYRVLYVTATPVVRIVVVTATATPNATRPPTRTAAPTRTPLPTATNTATATQTSTLEPHLVTTLGQGLIHASVRLPDNQTLYVLVDHWLRWYDTVTVTEQGALNLGEGFSFIQLNPGGRWAVIVGFRGLKVVDLTTGTITRDREGINSYFSGFAFSPDGQWLVLRELHSHSGGGYDTIERLSLLSRTGDMSLPANDSDFDRSFSNPAISPNGRWVAAGRDDQRVYVWDLATGQRLWALEGHAAKVTSVSFSPGSQLLASGSADGTVRLWDPLQGKLLRVITGFTNEISRVEFLPGETRLRVCVYAEPACQVWDAATGQLSAEPTAVAASVTPDPLLHELHQRGFAEAKYSDTVVAAGPVDGEVALGSEVVLIWAPGAVRPRLVLELTANDYVQRLVYSADGRRLAALTDAGRVIVWDTGSGAEVLRTDSATASRSGGLALSPAGNLVAYSADGEAVVWDLATNTALLRAPSPTGGGSAEVAFSADWPEFYAVWNSATAQVWSLDSRQLGQTDLPPAYQQVFSATALRWPLFARNGTDADGYFVELWDLEAISSVRLPLAAYDTTPLAFSPDGRLFVAHSGWQLLFWRTDTGALIYTTSAEFQFAEAAFSADGRQLLFGRDGRVTLWDIGAIVDSLDDPNFTPLPTPVDPYRETPRATATPYPALTLPAVTLPAVSASALTAANAAQAQIHARLGSGTIRAVRWALDGRQFYVAGDGGLFTYATETLDRLSAFDPGQALLAVAALPDGTVRTASVAGEQVQVWHGDQLLAELTGRGPMALSPDGQRLVLGGPAGLRTWDLATGRQLALMRNGSGNPPCFSPDGQLVAQAQRDHIRVWDARTGTIVAALDGPALPGANLAFSPDSHWVLSASGNAVWLWDVRPGGQALSYPLLTQSELSHWAEPVAATALALSPDGQVLAAGMSHGLVLLLDRETGAVLRRLEASASAITILQFSPDGKQLLAVEADGAITVWDAATGATLGRLTDHLGPVRGLEARADGQLWAWGDHTLWQVRPTEGVVAGTTAVVSDTFMAASPAGDLLVGYHPFQASLWEPQTGALLGPLPGEAPEAYVWRFTEQGFYAADVSADGQTVAVGGTGGVWVHTLATGRFSILGQGSLARALALSPDNRHLAACFDSYSFEFGCALFDLTTTRVVQRLLQDRASGIRSMAFAPNGRRLFGLTDSSYSPNDLLLWDVSRGEILFQRALDGEATSLAVSPDGSLLAVGYVDGRLELRDAATLETLTTLPASRGAVRALAFAVDGSWLASGADDGTITIWAAGD